MDYKISIAIWVFLIPRIFQRSKMQLTLAYETILNAKTRLKKGIRPKRIYNPITAMGFRQYLPHTVRKSRNVNSAKQVSNFLICGGNNVVDHYGRRIKILHGCPFEGWPNRARPSHPFWQLLGGWPCPVSSALKRTPVQDFNSFSMMFYYIITTTYQKIGDLFCPVPISGLSHSVISK